MVLTGLLCVSYNDAVYFDYFGVDYVPKEIRHFIGNKNRNKYRIQANNSIMYGYFSIGFIDFMLASKNLLY